MVAFFCGLQLVTKSANSYLWFLQVIFWGYTVLHTPTSNITFWGFVWSMALVSADFCGFARNFFSEVTAGGYAEKMKSSRDFCRERWSLLCGLFLSHTTLTVCMQFVISFSPVLEGKKRKKITISYSYKPVFKFNFTSQFVNLLLRENFH